MAAQQLVAAAGGGAAGPHQIHLQVVEGIADRGGLSRQLRIMAATELLQHPQGLLGPAGVGSHHLHRLLPLALGGMGQAGNGVDFRSTVKIDGGKDTDSLDAFANGNIGLAAEDCRNFELFLP